MADYGYDVSDHTDVDPIFGDLSDFDALAASARERDLRLMLDLVPSHTSIEHPWFREHPDRYIWADGDAPPNNWVSAFGGPAWTRDEESGRWYLHSFYPEQPDLDWRSPEVRAGIADVVRLWIGRGADGFRVDAVDRLMKDERLRDELPASAPFGLPLPEEKSRLDYAHSGNDPEIGLALKAIREAAGDELLVGEVYLPTPRLAPYLEYFDFAFGFDLLHATPDAERLAEVLRAGSETGRIAWMVSNHDFPRVATRWGEHLARAATVMLLTLPGIVFLYQGDELGLPDEPPTQAPRDRYGRDGQRHPMPWGDATGFTSGEPWLPVPSHTSVVAQLADPGSHLHLTRELIALRRGLGPGLEVLGADGGLLAYRRGNATVAVNFAEEPRRAPEGTLVIASEAGAVADGLLAPGAACVCRSELG